MAQMQADQPTNQFVLCCALIQGIGLLLMHNWVVTLAEPEAYYVYTFPLYTLISIVPLSLMMLANEPRPKVFLLTSLFSGVAALCGAYLGNVSYVKGLPHYSTFEHCFVFGASVFVAWFIALAFAEHDCQFKRWFSKYESLFDFSWRNAVKMLTACLFLGLFWAALGLLAALFKILGINFFDKLITNRHFVYPATTIAFGLGLALYSAREEVLSEFKRDTLQVLGWLLPLVSLILLGFVATLPFKGVKSLWATGYATNLMLSLLLLMVFLFNTAFQDGRKATYPKWVLKITNLGILTMPIYVLLCTYALYLRVHQYGWTADRVWAASFIIWVAIYGFGYAYSAATFFKEQMWMQFAKRVNIAAALVVVVILGLLNSPILNPMRIGVQSQVARLIEGKVQANGFDYKYLRFKGGKYGDEALKSLIANTSLNQSITIKSLAEATLKLEYPTYTSDNKTELVTVEVLKTKYKVYPKGTELDAGFYQSLLTEYNSNNLYRSCVEDKSTHSSLCNIILLDLNKDNHPEILVMDGSDQALLFQQEVSGGWHHVGILSSDSPGYNKYLGTVSALEEGNIQAMDPAWQVLQIGKNNYYFQPLR